MEDDDRKIFRAICAKEARNGPRQQYFDTERAATEFAADAVGREFVQVVVEKRGQNGEWQTLRQFRKAAT